MTSIKFIHNTFLFFLLPFFIFPQDQAEPVYPFVVDSVLISGNEITEPYIIMQELTFQKGDTLAQEDVEFNKERVYSLGLFNTVDIIPVRMNDISILNIDVSESWYIYPLPFITLKDKDWEKISYGLDVFIKNFRGKNETLRGRVSLGYDPSLFLSYYNPYISRENNISLGLSTSYQKSRNISSIAEFLYGDFFDYIIVNGQVSVGKRIDQFNQANTFITYSYIEAPRFIKGINASDNRIDRLLGLGASYTYDSRDLAQFPLHGLLGRATFQFKGLGLDDINYRILNLDFRNYYQVIGDLHFKYRLANRTTFGDLIPFYDFSYLGFGERIRGHFYKAREGHNSYVANTEIYYPLIKEWIINLDFVPLLPKELLKYRVAFYTQAFADAGATRFHGEKLSFNNFDLGYGAGITLLILPHNTFRLEAAFDDKGNLEWIFDLGVSF